MKSSQHYASSNLARRVDRIINDKTLLTENTSEKSPARISISKRALEENSYVTNPPRPVSLDQPKSKSRLREKVKSLKSLPRKSSLDKIQMKENIEEYHPWVKLREELKLKISILEESLSLKEEKISSLSKQVLEQGSTIKQIKNESLISIQKRDSLISQLRDQIEHLEHKEENFGKELKEQQLITKDAISKLHELQDMASKEIEKAKIHYKAYYGKILEDELDEQTAKVYKIQEEQDRLYSTLKKNEYISNMERNNEATELSNELLKINNQYNKLVVENERLKSENKRLVIQIDENEKTHNSEIEILKNRIDYLEQDRLIATQEDEKRKKEVINERIIQLEQEILAKDKILQEKDQNYKNQLFFINEKLEKLQAETRIINEYETQIYILNEQLDSKEREMIDFKRNYKERMAAKQARQKEEWSSIYNELLSEMRTLRDEIDNLEMQNRNLISKIEKNF